VIIIAVTAHAFKSERLDFINNGCNECVVKPYQRLELLRVMVELLKIEFVYAEETETPASWHNKTIGDTTEIPVKDTPLSEIIAQFPSGFMDAFKDEVMLGQFPNAKKRLLETVAGN